MIGRQHPLVKFAAFSLLGLLGSGLRMWSPAEALVICSVAFAADGLLTSLILAARRSRSLGPRWLDFLVPFVALFLGRGLATLLGLD